MKLESLSFRDRFDILLEKRLSSVAGLTYIMVYGKSQIEQGYTMIALGLDNVFLDESSAAVLNAARS